MRQLCLAIASLAGMFLTTTINAQEAFPATHAASIFPINSIPQPGQGSGLAFMRVDPFAQSVQVRITLITPGDTVTSILIRRHTPTGADPIIQVIPYPEAITTVMSQLDVFDQEVYNALDSNLLYLDVRSKAHPDSFMVGDVAFVPNAIAYEIDGSQEVPSVDSSNGDGTAFVTVDRASHSAHYLIEWRGMSGPATAAYFHRGKEGENGPAVHTVALTPGEKIAVGTWTGMTDEDIAAFKTGMMYVNLQSARYPNGEIRGALSPVDVFSVALEPFNEVPAVITSPASGTALVTLTGAGDQGGFVRVNGLVGDNESIDSTAIHKGAIGENGPKIFYAGGSTTHEISWEANFSPSEYDSAALSAMRSGNAYLNVRSPKFPNGEVRGQLIPASTNLTLTSSVAVGDVAEHGALSATVVDGGSRIHFRFPDAGVHADRIVLYSAIGARAASVELAGTDATMNTSMLPSGFYMAQAVSGTKPVGTCRVMLVR